MGNVEFVRPKNYIVPPLNNNCLELFHLIDANYLQFLVNKFKKDTKIDSIKLIKQRLTISQLEILYELLKNKRIWKCNLAFNQLNDDCIKSLSNFLLTNNHVRDLIICNNSFSSKGLNFLFKDLSLNHSLISLNLSQNNIDEEGVKIIANYLSKNQNIKKLNLGYNSLSDKSIKSINFFWLNHFSSHYFFNN